MSSSERLKGQRIEREIVDRHRELGVRAERVPLSGASKYRGNGADVDIHAFGQELLAEVKARGNGGGFVQQKKWLGNYDLLFLREDRCDPMVVMPWRTYVHFLEWMKEAEEVKQAYLKAMKGAQHVVDADDPIRELRTTRGPGTPREASAPLSEVASDGHESR